MFPSGICRLSIPLAASVFRASIAGAETAIVGAVDKVQAHVDATQVGQTRALVVNSEMYQGSMSQRRGRASSGSVERRQ